MNNYGIDNLVSVNIRNFLPEIGMETIREEIIKGLRAPEKYISSKFFYDETGSRLFEAITRLEEYYPARTEKALLEEISPVIAGGYPFNSIVELGSGDCSKISLFLSSFSKERLMKLKYIPVDISQPAIEESIYCLSRNFDEVEVEGIVADFFTQLDSLPKNECHRLFCFFGSTLGNFEPVKGRDFINEIGSIMRKGDMFLLGVDMIKDTNILENAYNDKKGVTADFNLNILNAVNNLLQTGFDTGKFEHLAFYNSDLQRIEMHLKALEDMKISSPFLDYPVYLKKGENIHTENSYKFLNEEIIDLCRMAGLTPVHVYSDQRNWFSVFHFLKSTV